MLGGAPPPSRPQEQPAEQFLRMATKKIYICGRLRIITPPPPPPPRAAPPPPHYSQLTVLEGDLIICVTAAVEVWVAGLRDWFHDAKV